ncbi:hypothetical protein SAMN06298216_4155 [Spirosomataceae bacterium TFI 002]|nr:hypothetical protein SAMN06298216_4155 [Spirosomataceae bacterium TFI 002]
MSKIIIFSLLGLLPFSCAKQTPVTEQKTDISEPKASSSRVLPGENSVLSTSYQRVNGQVTPVSRLVLNESGIVNDQFWGQHWENSNANEKVAFWSTERYNKIRGSEIKNVDLSEMKGFDFSPIITYMNNAKPWEGKTFVQSHVYVPTDEERNNWTEGKMTYFFLPKTYKRDPNSNLPQFDLTFPTYELPKGKFSANNFSMYGRDDNKILKQGHSFILSYNLPVENRSFYDYDNWLYQAGCPHAYSVDNEEIVRWLDNVDENVLLNSFKKNFYEEYKDYGYIVMNWEAIAGARSASFWKLQKCFDFWFSQKPKAKLAIWGKGGFWMNRLQTEGDNFEYYFTKAITTNQPISEYQKPITNENPMSVDGFYTDNADVIFIGGYLNYPTNYGYVQHFLMQHMMNKKYYPQKKSVLSWWENIEYVGDFETSNFYFKDHKGKTVYTDTKPMVFPDAMHNASVWAHAFCDGADLWSSPYARTDDPTHLGPSTEVFDLNNKKIPTSFKPNSNAQYAVQNYQNIDRWEGGKWAISQSKDIIDANSKWEFTRVKKGNQAYDRTIPSYSLYQKTPLVAYKLSADKKEALVLAYDAWNNPLKQTVLSVEVAGKSYSVKVFGRYTSVVRIQLD